MTSFSRDVASLNEDVSPELANVVESMMERLRLGQSIDMEAICAQYPKLEDQLRGMFPAMSAVADLGKSLSGDDATPRTSPDASKVEQLGDFRIEREIGRGGMGIVYQAEQLSLGRRVALKVLPLVGMLDPRQLQRFRNEARAAAALKHSNIVSVYAVDSDRGVHFYAMELVEGQSLDRVIQAMRDGDHAQCSSESAADDSGLTSFETCPSERQTDPIAALSTESNGNQRQYIRSVSRLMVQAAEALHYAHQEGVVHRDIKPSNLMIDRAGKIWITDFGLARMQSDADMTLTGDLVGTLRYMSPEQARGHGVVDQRSDVYSLGLTLFELLTLRPAFPETDRAALIHAVIESTPPAPRKVNSAIPSALETIVLKATSKSPDARYQSARELADDLERFLAHKPIRAKRSSRLERVWRWSIRNPTLATLAASTIVLLAVLSVGGPIAAVRQSFLARTLSAAVYDAQIKVAHAALLDGEFQRVDRILRQLIPMPGETDYRHFEWNYLWRECQQGLQSPRLQGAWPLRSVEYSPNGQYLGIAGNWGIFHIRDARNLGRISSKHWNDVDNLSHRDHVNAVTFSPDSRFAVTGGRDGRVIVWDCGRERKLGERQFGSYIRSLAYSPDGSKLAIGFEGDEDSVKQEAAVQLCRVVTMEAPHGSRVKLTDHKEFNGSRHTVSSIAFSKDGSSIAVGSSDNQVRIWDLETGNILSKVVVPYDAVRAVAFSPTEASLLAVISQRVTHERDTSLLSVWDVATADQHAVVGDDGGRWNSMEFSRAGSRLAIAGSDGRVSLLDTVTWAVESVEQVHTGPITDVAFSPDGRQIATCSRDSTVHVLDIVSRQENGRTLAGHDSTVLGIAVSNDSKHLLSVGIDRAKAKLWDIASQTCLAEVSTAADELMAVAISPDSRTAVIGGGKWRHDGRPVELFLWDLVRRKRLRTLLQYPSSVNKDDTHIMSAAFSPNGERVAATVGKSVVVWNVKTGSQCYRLDHRTMASRVAWSSIDVIACATGLPRSEVVFWNANTGERIGSLPPVQFSYTSVNFSPDGRTLAVAGGSSHSITLCDVANRCRLFDLVGHSGRVYCLDYSSDGKRLASSGNGCVKIWNLKTRTEVLSLPEPDVFSWSVKFAPDGSALFASDTVSGVRRCPIYVWRAATPESVASQVSAKPQNWLTLD